ncbi:hypothetical protein G1K66_12000 [Tenacibaculum finnmarkense]|uniref:hypothetical protein n=2 Tax=Tenacibaculum finnmarkense TaxID=2781243 RepID=UPI001E2964A7|nr:hypothetical protein [Tenacibaculum finnmarkense]MCD8401286.1 hypothetical protein [Tenacibaculum finnmarkense genomovar ulcerans]MCD8433618.1 hypothetical protein [Tenacibaculum finnmarkense genomovar ulcerans]MCG8786413.1 hypothetical protein [Tenacibaculum finnmarkense]MCG8796595.1 hypothetical protein [Tenacibaculum finnmarkense]MCG8798966.1 hypothetical protein [Tenacibaculum finnmarkense]
MKKYDYFHKILISYIQGTMTEMDIKSITDFPFEIKKLSEWSSFYGDLESTLMNKYNDIYVEWSLYVDDAKETTPTIKGLIHSINEYLKGKITQKQFIEWSCWNNAYGGTSNGRFENSCIETICLYFIPKNYENLKINFYQKMIPLIEKSNTLAYEEFIIALYLLIDKERKSFYFFIKQYIDGNKTENDLSQYLVKKFNVNLLNLASENFDFPYLSELRKYKDEKRDVNEFISLMEK